MPRGQVACPWVTPKVFHDFDDPEPVIRSFFDHYARWFMNAESVVLNFCTGNGDHILGLPPGEPWGDVIEWARWNSYHPDPARRAAMNAAWMSQVREGGERSANPYLAGPSVLMNDTELTYGQLRNIYGCFRQEAQRRGLNFRLLEYLEPGPEFCRSQWKTDRHPEAAQGRAMAGAEEAAGVIDVTVSLVADSHQYAAFPDGVEAGTLAGDFVAAQTAAFTQLFGLDGVFLGNQFGLVGFWDPANAPAPTEERRAGIARFFTSLRAAMGDRLIYWMDTYWPVDVEVEQWAMSDEAYAALDAVMCSNFAVLVRPENIVPNLESRLALAARLDRELQVLFSLDFVDPWYWYRVHLDLRPVFDLQREIYAEHGARASGVSFFANDTFGLWVPAPVLDRTLDVLDEIHGRAS